MREKVTASDVQGRFGAVGKESFLNDVIYPLCEIYGREMDAKTATLWYNALKGFASGTLAEAAERVVEGRRT
ncbi:MAG: hypothetical protein ABW189_06740 [Rickettsiales bacterium]